MNMHTPAAHTRQMRRARAVHAALRTGRASDAAGSARSKGGTILPELAALTVFAMAAAGIIALRAWLAVGG